MPAISKPLVVTSAVVGVVALGSAAYIYSHRRPVRNALHRVRSYFLPTQDEGFSEISKTEDVGEKKILFLGLNGSGKTEILRDLAAAASERLSGFEPKSVDRADQEEAPKPTEGIKVTTVTRNGATYHLWEVGGGAVYRQYWSHFFDDTDLLVFVIDASASDRLPSATEELRKLASEQRLRHVPFVIVANKQNISTAQSGSEIGKATDIESLRAGDGPVRVLEASRGLKSHEEFYDRLFHFCDTLC